MIRSDRSASARSTIARRSGSSEQRPVGIKDRPGRGFLETFPKSASRRKDRYPCLVHDRHSTVTDGSQYRYVTSIQRCTTLRDDAAGWYILAASPDVFRRRR